MTSLDDVLGVPVRDLSVVSGASAALSLVDDPPGTQRIVGLYGVEAPEWGPSGWLTRQALANAIEMSGPHYRMHLIDVQEASLPLGVIWDERAGPQGSINRVIIEIGMAFYESSHDGQPWQIDEAQRLAQLQVSGYWGMRESDRPHRVRQYPITLKEVVNGESLLVTTHTDNDWEQKKRQIFLHGIEAPWRGRFGRLAKEELQRQLDSSTSQLWIHEVSVDDLGRPVGIVFNENAGLQRSVNNRMVAAGAAYDRNEFASPRWRLDIAEREARAQRLGFWRLEESKQPWRALDLSVDLLRVIDGDSVKVLITESSLAGKVAEVRLNGIDAPELDQLGGQSSADVLTSYLSASNRWRIRVSEIDRYKRLAAVIYAEGLCPEMSANVKMVRDGFAYWYKEYADPRMGFEEAERLARAGQRGLWAEPNLERPWDYRRRKRTESTRRRSNAPNTRSRASSTSPLRRPTDRPSRPVRTSVNQSNGGCLSTVAIAAGIVACVGVAVYRLFS